MAKSCLRGRGSKKFEDTNIADMVKGGAIGNGNFAMHAKAVFQSRTPRFQFAGSRIGTDGRKNTSGTSSYRRT